MEYLEGDERSVVTWHDELLTRRSQRTNAEGIFEECQHTWGGFRLPADYERTPLTQTGLIGLQQTSLENAGHVIPTASRANFLAYKL